MMRRVRSPHGERRGTRAERVPRQAYQLTPFPQRSRRVGRDFDLHRDLSERERAKPRDEKPLSANREGLMVELRGLEPLTPRMPF
jgi:hypothetical protein